jgi:ring-1,2-phenylacetyl-CoA epoxidase subunit PaaE
MDEVVVQAFLECGVPGKNMHREHFGGQESKSDAPVAGVATECSAQIQLHGKNYTIPVKKGQTVLEAMLAAKVDAPYSCMSGACSTCMAKLLSGEVSMDVSHGLDQDEIDQGYILTCQSRALSSEAHIDFDA